MESAWARPAAHASIGLVQYALSPSLKRLCSFEDFDENLATAATGGPMVRPGYHPGQPSYSNLLNNYRPLHRTVAQAFAYRSLTLEYLAASYVLDARDFIVSTEQDWIWTSLETLALTSQVLQRTNDPQPIHHLLCGAGTMALQMPQLRTMVLWNGGRGNACAFVFEASQSRISSARISWRGTWDLEFCPRVVSAWQLVASQLCSKPLETRKQMIDKEISSHGDAIEYLELPCRVIEPASLWQIRREARIPFV